MKNKVALLVAMILGIFAMMAVFLTIKKQQDAQKIAGLKIKVAAATSAVPGGTTFRNEHYMWIEVPKLIYDKMSDTLLSEGDIDTFIDKKKLKEDLKVGSLIMKHQFRGGGAQDDSIIKRQLKTGYRALSIGVDYPQGVSGLLKPASYVDVLGTFSFEIEGFGKYQLTFTLADNVRVLAVDSYTDIALSDSGSKRIVEYGSVTLMVKKEELEYMVYAYKFGSLHLAYTKRGDPASSGRAADAYTIIQRSKSNMANHPSMRKFGGR